MFRCLNSPAGPGRLRRGFVGKEIAEKQEVHVLVHSAGLGQRSLVLETTTNVDLEEKLLRVNVLGPIALTKGVLPSMVGRHRGQIVGINSVQGQMGVPMRAAYSASKFALKSFLWSIRSEFHALGIDKHLPWVCADCLFLECSKRPRTEHRSIG